MKFWFDTEFVEDGKTIDLISIAIVAEDGREYHAVSSEFDIEKARAHPFVSVHVLPHIEDYPAKTRKQIAEEIVAFCGDEPEFWADFASYDWVALCQLFGTMMDLPKGWPFFCRDVQQFRKMLGVAKFTVNSHGEHDALADARECKARYDVLAKGHELRGWPGSLRRDSIGKVIIGAVARGWCQPETSSYEMDAVLAGAISRSVTDAINIPVAYRIIQDAMQSDDGYAWGWYCNIAMAMYDEHVDLIYARRGAARFMKMCFDVDITECKEWTPDQFPV